MSDSSSKTKIQNLNTADASALEELVGYNLKRAYMIVREDFRSTVGKNGLGPREFSALALVIDYPSISQSDLARKLGIERSGLVAIIDELERRGYVSRTVVPDDRRVQALQPLAAGKKAYKATHTKILQHEKQLLSGLSAAEIKSLLGLLRKIRSGDS